MGSGAESCCLAEPLVCSDNAEHGAGFPDSSVSLLWQLSMRYLSATSCKPAIRKTCRTGWRPSTGPARSRYVVLRLAPAGDVPVPVSSGLFSLCGAGAARNRFLAAAVRASFLCLGDFLNPSPSWNAGACDEVGHLGARPGRVGAPQPCACPALSARPLVNAGRTLPAHAGTAVNQLQGKVTMDSLV